MIRFLHPSHVIGLLALLLGAAFAGCGVEPGTAWCDTQTASCDDGDPCTNDECVPQSGGEFTCINTPIGDGGGCVISGMPGMCQEGTCTPSGTGGSGGTAGSGGSAGSGGGGEGGAGGDPTDTCFNAEVRGSSFGSVDFTVTDVPTGGASQTSAREVVGGNPGFYQRMEHLLPGNSTISVFHLGDGLTYDPGGGGGAISHLRYSEDHLQFSPPFSSAAIGWGVFIEQGGVRYTVSASSPFTETTWTTAEILGIRADDFNGGTPDFSESGGEITFGYFRSNSNSNSSEYTTTHGIDNFEVTICKVLPE